MARAPIILAGFIGVLSSFAVTAAQAATELAPHRAFYSVSLAKNSVQGQVLGVDGVMTMTMERTCDGWIFTQDMETVIALENGSALSQSALFTSWESLDGLEYRFASRYRNGGGSDQIRGRAELRADGSGTAHYSEPEKAEVELPRGTLFPISHTAWLIDEAASGARYASRVVFTGSEELEPELINVFIGNPVDSARQGEEPNGMLSERTGWPLTMAFHSVASATGVPSFEMNAMQLDNGVAPNLRMNFGEFATEMKVERLEPIASPDCP